MSTETAPPFFSGKPRWKRIAALNVSAVIGTFLAGLALPEDTPLWVWVCSAIAALIVLNFLVYRRGRKRVADTKPDSRRSTFVIVGCFLLLIADIAWTYFSRER